jgi:hypothetical protein
MVRVCVAVIRPFFSVVVIGVMLSAAACGPLQQSRPDPLKFRSAQLLLRTDRLKMVLDLGRVRQDAKRGQTGGNGFSACYNLTQNVDVDVTRMDNFAVGTVTDEVAAMQGDVNAVRAARADFARDINGFVNDGVARPATEPSTIAAITAKIEHAVSQADRTINRIQVALSNAHSSADSLAFGRCAHKAAPAAPLIPRVH